MDFIQTSNKAVDLFGAGKHGFNAGNPSSGVLATFFSSGWANDVQQELINAIEAAGIVPAAGTRNQLLAAIQALITGRFTGVNQQLTTEPWQKLPGGLLLQWGESTLPASGSNTAGVSVVYPLTFPVALAGPFAIPYESVNSDVGYTPIMRTLIRTTAGFTLVGDTNNTVIFNKTCKFGWFSIGF